MWRANMQEVKVEAFNLGAVLGKAVEPRFAEAPVVVCAPVLDERPEFGEGHALRPVGDSLALGPANARQALPQIVECALRSAIGEGADGRICAGSPKLRQAGDRYGGSPFQECAARCCGDRSKVAAALRCNR